MVRELSPLARAFKPMFQKPFKNENLEKAFWASKKICALLLEAHGELSSKTSIGYDIARKIHNDFAGFYYPPHTDKKTPEFLEKEHSMQPNFIDYLARSSEKLTIYISKNTKFLPELIEKMFSMYEELNDKQNYYKSLSFLASSAEGLLDRVQESPIKKHLTKVFESFSEILKEFTWNAKVESTVREKMIPALKFLEHGKVAAVNS